MLWCFVKHRVNFTFFALQLCMFTNGHASNYLEFYLFYHIVLISHLPFNV